MLAIAPYTSSTSSKSTTQVRKNEHDNTREASRKPPPPQQSSVQLARRPSGSRPRGLGCSPPALPCPALPLRSSILGLICLAGHLGRTLAGVEDPQTDPISRPNAIPGAAVGWWAAASPPRRLARLIGRAVFQAADPRSAGSRCYKTTPLSLSVSPSGRRAWVPFTPRAAGWAAGCIIYSLSRLF